jgi:phosphatidylserine decarboxylase
MALLSPYGKPQTTFIGIVGAAMIAGSTFMALRSAAPMGWWLTALTLVVAVVVLLAFFRDPDREVPTQRGQVVAPADGRISSIHDVENYEPFRGPAKCIRIFLSVLDVHVNRSPMHGRVTSVTHKPGLYMNALKAESAEHNESVTIVLEHPAHGFPVAAIRQVAGAIARRIVCGVKSGDTLQRGQRFGLIKFGSTTEVYLPNPERVDIRVRKGQYVWGGNTVLAVVTSKSDAASPASETETPSSAISPT